MTESEWEKSIDPHQMLDFLVRPQRRSNRKLRLYGCACCRRIWHLMRDSRSRHAVEVAEAYADRRAKLKEAQAGARVAVQEIGYLAGVGASSVVECSAAEAAREVVGHFPIGAANWGSDCARGVVMNADDRTPAAIQNEHAIHAGFLRDIFGNPFRQVILDLTWKTPTVLALAQVAYDNRILPAGTLEPAWLAVLADALEEAGCTDADILGHLRGPGPHVRGCWPVDLILGKV